MYYDSTLGFMERIREGRARGTLVAAMAALAVAGCAPPGHDGDRGVSISAECGVSPPKTVEHATGFDPNKMPSYDEIVAMPPGEARNTVLFQRMLASGLLRGDPDEIISLGKLATGDYTPAKISMQIKYGLMEIFEDKTNPGFQPSNINAEWINKYLDSGLILPGDLAELKEVIARAMKKTGGKCAVLRRAEIEQLHLGGN